MARQFPQLNPSLIDFIQKQKMFFTASATDSSRINLSPRSTDYFRILDDNTALYLDRTGSGNETAAHMLADGRMTIMFCAVEEAPRILRLYGKGDIIHRESDEYSNMIKSLFNGEKPLGSRQIVRLRFDLVQTSCGFGVPLFQYQGERDTMDRWAEAKGENGIIDYWHEKNQKSIDELPTDLLKRDA